MSLLKPWWRSTSSENGPSAAAAQLSCGQRRNHKDPAIRSQILGTARLSLLCTGVGGWKLLARCTYVLHMHWAVVFACILRRVDGLSVVSLHSSNPFHSRCFFDSRDFL